MAWTANVGFLSPSAESTEALVTLTDGTQTLKKLFQTDGTQASLAAQCRAFTARIDTQVVKRDLVLGPLDLTVTPPPPPTQEDKDRAIFQVKLVDLRAATNSLGLTTAIDTAQVRAELQALLDTYPQLAALVGNR